MDKLQYTMYSVLYSKSMSPSFLADGSTTLGTLAVHCDRAGRSCRSDPGTLNILFQVWALLLARDVVLFQVWTYPSVLGVQVCSKWQGGRLPVNRAGHIKVRAE
jgi:hypothetical protein